MSKLDQLGGRLASRPAWLKDSASLGSAEGADCRCAAWRNNDVVQRLPGQSYSNTDADWLNTWPGHELSRQMA